MMQVVVTLALIHLSFGQFPDSEYCSILCPRGQHTLCRYESVGPNCREIRSLMDESRRAVILKLHNTFRDSVAVGMELSLPQSANMRQLYWDLELEAIAERWAMQCNGSYPDECRDVTRFKVGQVMSKTKIISTDMNYYYALFDKLWFAEVTKMDSRIVENFQKERGVQHVAQILAATTSRIGCADVLYRTTLANKPWRTTVCNYAPLVEANSELYQTGTPCSRCPHRTACQGPQSSYPHLCSEIRHLKLDNRRNEKNFDYDIADDMEIKPSILGASGVKFRPRYGGRAGIVDDGHQVDEVGHVPPATLMMNTSNTLTTSIHPLSTNDSRQQTASGQNTTAESPNSTYTVNTNNSHDETTATMDQLSTDEFMSHSSYNKPLLTSSCLLVLLLMIIQ